MKKILFALFAACCMLVSCGGGGTDTEAEIAKACNEGDFEKARDIAEAAYGSRNPGSINKREVYTLLANLNKDNANRILYLYNTINEHALPDVYEVMETAISGGDSYLADKLIRAGHEPNERVINAAINQEMLELVELCIKKNPKFVLNTEVEEFVKENIGNEVFEAAEGKIKKEATQEFKSKVEELAAISIPARPALGIQQSDHYGDIGEEYIMYNRDVEELNSKCKDLLSQALEMKDQATAKKILALMRPTLSWQNLGNWDEVVFNRESSTVYRAYKITAESTDIEQARAMIEAAQ